MSAFHMPLLLLFLIASFQAPFAHQVQQAYARQDAEALRTLLVRADSRADSLLVRYRLYPLAQDASLLEPLPESLQTGTAQERALLSGLWSYRAGEASILHTVSYGRRSTKVLDRARATDPVDPYVLLVEGQSLLFRPAIAGRDPETAVERFSTLIEQVDQKPPVGISTLEARVWKWLALREADRMEEARALHETLTSRSLPPLYRQFLNDPPEV